MWCGAFVYADWDQLVISSSKSCFASISCFEAMVTIYLLPYIFWGAANKPTHCFFTFLVHKGRGPYSV